MKCLPKRAADREYNQPKRRKVEHQYIKMRERTWDGPVSETQRPEFSLQNPYKKLSTVSLALAYSPSVETGRSLGLSSQLA